MTDKLEQARAHFLDGLAHFQAARLAQAALAFEASLALVPGRVSTLTNLGATRVRLGQPQAAQPLLEQASAAEPGNLEAWYNLGLVHKALGRPEDALECFDKAVALDQNSLLSWLYRAQVLSLLGQPEEALASFDRATAIQPDFAQAWSDQGTLLRDMNRLEDAAASFEKAIALGADAELNRWFLASVRAEAGGTPLAAPRAYVEHLFDDYAGDFQEHLVGVLGYRAHDVLVKQVLQAAPRRYRSVLDLGCGTGLCGQLIKPVADRVDGVDLSAAMVEESRRTGAYTQLVHADVVEYLADAQRSDDLVLAADVFIYVGGLEPVFTGVARILEPGGRFCFTVEPAPDTLDVQLMPSLRYAHSEAYVRRLAAQHGFKVDDMVRAPLRNDQGQPLEGLYFYLTRN